MSMYTIIIMVEFALVHIFYSNTMFYDNVLVRNFNRIHIMEHLLDESSEIPSLFKMTRAQEERCERNRLKAKALQHSRLARRHPYAKPTERSTSNDSSQGPSSQNLTDTCGGYVLEDEDSENAIAHVILAEDEGLGIIYARHVIGMLLSSSPAS